jgi:hypothetical protein
VKRPELAEITDLYLAAEPVASLYLDLGPTPGNDATPHRDLRWRALRDRLVAGGIDDATCRALDRVVRRTSPAPRVLTAFAAAGEARVVHELAGSVGGDLALPGPLPHAAPLLRWLQSHPAYVVVVTDRAGADVLVQPRAGEPAHHDLVVGHDDEIERNAPGGWSQARYQRRALDSWAHNGGEVAEAVVRDVDAIGARLVLVGGDVRAVQALRDHLPERVRALVHVLDSSGGPRASWSAATREREVAAAVADRVRHAEEALVARMRDGLGEHGHAVTGVEMTVAALRGAQVDTLLIADEVAETHRGCIGPDPVHVAVRPWELDDLGVPMREVRLGDALIRAALGTDADVHVLPEPLGPGLDGRVAAILRYR